MIKRIIFDLDGTLIKFPNNMKEEFKKVLDKHNININSKRLYEVIGKYDKSGNYLYYDMEKLIKFVNKKLNLELGIDFWNDFFKMYNKLITPLSKEEIETLEYLNKKYELVVLTNWFTDSQIARLKCAGIYKYFSKVYGGDIVKLKPNKESFISAMEGLKPNECVMVGDNLELDILVPFNMGMEVYYVTKKDNLNYNTIKKLEDLKERL